MEVKYKSQVNPEQERERETISYRARKATQLTLICESPLSWPYCLYSYIIIDIELEVLLHVRCVYIIYTASLNSVGDISDCFSSDKVHFIDQY